MAKSRVVPTIILTLSDGSTRRCGWSATYRNWYGKPDDDGLRKYCEAENKHREGLHKLSPKTGPQNYPFAVSAEIVHFGKIRASWKASS